jgi:cellulose biosynthesis protein BcsQ
MTTGLIVAVANLKAGTSKTTTCMFLSAALQFLGFETVLVDADKGDSATRWAEDAGELPFTVMSMHSQQIYHQASSVIRHSQYDCMVIDCPQLEDHRGITMPALRLATDVLVPLAPHWIETDRTALVAKELDDVDVLRDSKARRWALLTRTVNAQRTKKGVDALVAEVLTEQGYQVMPENVKSQFRPYAEQGGEIPRGLERTPFLTIARRLLVAAGADLEGVA